MDNAASQARDFTIRIAELMADEVNKASNSPNPLLPSTVMFALIDYSAVMIAKLSVELDGDPDEICNNYNVTLRGLTANYIRIMRREAKAA
jgi:hypothetical protein